MSYLTRDHILVVERKIETSMRICCFPLARRLTRVDAEMRIAVHAFGNGSAWRQAPAIVQYTLVAEKGMMI